MIIYAIINGTEIGVKLNTEEVEAMGAGFVNIFSDPESSKAYFDMLSKIGAAANEAAERKDSEPEKEQDEEYEKKRNEAIQKLKDLGCIVKEEDDVYECKTSAIWENKYALVKAWLIDHEIEFEEKLNSSCRKEIHYDLDMMQLAEMIDWLDDHGDEKFDTTIQI